MNDDNYVSPYGFGPITDAVVDAVADRHELTAQQIADVLDALSEEEREALEYWVDTEWWPAYMGVALDKMEDRLYDYLPTLSG